MFKIEITTEAIPERVFALFQIVKDKKTISKKELEEKMEPAIFNKNSYFDKYLKVAEEIEVIKQEGGLISYDSKADSIKTIEDMRKYVNLLWPVKYGDGPFAEITKSFYNSNKDIFKYASITEMKDLLPNEPSNARVLLGYRFWASFLGLGMLYGKADKDNTGFIPDCTIFLEDIICSMNLEKNKKYSIDEFISIIYPVAHPVIGNSSQDKRINYGLSSSLRILHDEKIIKLEFINDQKSFWMLDRLDMHQIQEKVSHITVLR